jgi:hypothetical protein
MSQFLIKLGIIYALFHIIIRVLIELHIIAPTKEEYEQILKECNKDSASGLVYAAYNFVLNFFLITTNVYQKLIFNLYSKPVSIELLFLTKYIPYVLNKMAMDWLFLNKIRKKTIMESKFLRFFNNIMKDNIFICVSFYFIPIPISLKIIIFCIIDLKLTEYAVLILI